MIFWVILAFVVGVVVGAFSHKWLAKETESVTGVKPQTIADQINKKI